MLRKWTWILGVLLLAVLVWSVSAQENPTETVTPEVTEPPGGSETVTPPPPISVTGSEPQQLMTGSGGTLSVFGANFTEGTIVRLVGYGLLSVTFVNSNALMATLPADVPPGDYSIEVTSPSGQTVPSPHRLSVRSVPQPLPTIEPPTPFPTVPPATPIPGQPSLVVRNFSADPIETLPGNPVTLNFEVVNQGNRTAEGVSVSVDPGGKFVPANGQASATLPNLPPGASAQVRLTVLAAMDAPVGPNSVPVTMTYRDFEGESYSTTAALSVTVAERDMAIAQVILSGYRIDPSPAEPGSRVTVEVDVTNIGNEMARQVLLRVSGESSILLAGSQGDSVPIGDLPPGETRTVELPMVISREAEAGPQAQPLRITTVHEGETQEVNSSITVDVAQVFQPEPLILLQAYSTGEEILKPGDRFNLSLTLQNVGSGDAAGMLVTFGTVESSGSGGNGGSGSGSGSGSGTGSGGGTTTNPIPGNAFAPLGVGDTLYIGSLPTGDSVALEQAFIVNSNVNSGIYSLPVTVRYQKPDGESGQANLNASVIVVAPPRLRADLMTPLPEMVMMGEPLPLAFEIVNLGTTTIKLDRMTVTADNGEIVDGAQTVLDPLSGDDDIVVNAVVMPSEEGALEVTFTLHYTDDLNAPQTIDYTYETTVEMPPPMPTEEFPPEMPTPEVEEPAEENWLGRLLLGFLGLGG